MAPGALLHVPCAGSNGDIMSGMSPLRVAPGLQAPAVRHGHFSLLTGTIAPGKQPDARERRSAIRGASTPIYMPDPTKRRGCLDPCAHGLT